MKANALHSGKEVVRMGGNWKERGLDLGKHRHDRAEHLRRDIWISLPEGKFAEERGRRGGGVGKKEGPFTQRGL